MDLFPLWNSLRIAFFASIIVFIFGVLFAALIKKCPKIVKGILDVILTLPLVLPPTVCGYFLLLIFGKTHPIGEWLSTMGISFVMDWKGGILAATVVAFPLMYRTVRASFESFDENIAYAGQTLGLSNPYIFWRIKMPACKSGIIAGSVLAFARALGEYGATSMLIGYMPSKTATIATTVYQFWRTDNEQMAMIWVGINLAISTIVLIAINLFENSERKKVRT